MDNKNKYWKGFEELNNDPQFIASKKNEFAEGLPLQEILDGNDFDLASNRRDFLKYFGFGLSAVTLAACNTAPIRNAIPYVVKPDVITPGVANWYASTCGACSSGCGILVKTREGRPIKIEGNENSPISKGGVCAFGHGTLLSLYDLGRASDFSKGEETLDTATADKEIKAALANVAASGKGIRIVSSTINSPSTRKVIADFIAKYPSTKHIVYDAVSNSGILAANSRSFGKAVIPGYRFDKAKVIVSFDADFLGCWISPVEYIKQYSSTRKLSREKKEMSRHIQFEPRLSVTGSNADVRIPIKPSQEGALLLSLYNNLAGSATVGGGAKTEVAMNMIAATAKELMAAKGQSLVVSGSNDVNVQLMVNGINMLLGNYGTTIDLDNYSLQKMGNDADFETFVSELNKGDIGAVIFYNVNPVYSYRNGNQIADGIKKAALSISTAGIPDETSRLTKYNCPDNHYLESWNDAEPRAGVFQLTQPTISPVFRTRQAQESLMRWAGNDQDYYTYIQDYWKTNMFGTQTAQGDFVSFWNRSLHDGVFLGAPKTPTTPAFGANLNDFAGGMNKGGQANDELEVILYEKVGLKNGSAGNNPWMHELPDPISKVCWDNYASFSKSTADKLGLEEGNLVNVTVNGKTISDLPVLVQPGQARNTVAIAVGYGRDESGKAPIGKNAFPLASFANGSVQYYSGKGSASKAVGSYKLAQTQTHHTIEGRALVKEATLEEYIKDASAGNHDHHDLISLWDERDYKGHHWKMAIDLNACTGCGACVVSCQSENNVPVVGRTEVLRSREMHWMRIDRYYSFVGKEKGTEKKVTISKERQMEDSEQFDQESGYDNVKVVFQPMLCQQCGHAPCESVCPVLATTHSSEGLNQMTYNRCIGTKYCANNCPYKVRRFNWFRYNDNDDFNYHFNNDLGKMVINPDVTVRTRGVMEKCTFCVQRIQEGKLTAKKENRKMKDGDIKTACQQSCPANAIVFGDYNDKESEVYKLFKNERKYHVLEELDVQPSVGYLTKVRNLSVAESVGMWKPSEVSAHKEGNTTEHPAENLEKATQENSH